MWLFEPKQAQYLWANPAGLAFWNARSTNDIHAKDPSDSLSRAAKAQWARCRAAGVNNVLSPTTITLTPRGTPVRVQLRSRAVTSDCSPELLLLLEATPLEALLDEEARHARNVVSSIPIGITIFDFGGNPLWENAAAKGLFDTLAGRRPTLRERCHQESSTDRIQTYIVAGRPYRGEVELATNRGRLWSLLEAQPSTDRINGEPRVVVVHVDIHHWKTAELALREAKNTAEKANQTKSEFLANMSHEIRTPMNGVLGAIELLDRSYLDGPQRRLVCAMQRSARTLLMILNDILDLSRIEAGKLRLDHIKFNLVETIQDVIALHRQTAKQRGIELRSVFEDGIPQKVIGDPYRLSQVMGNLLGNAVKFTDEGFIEATVNVIENNENEVVIRHAVRDTGCGIDLEQQEKIFRAFEQADASVTRRHGGTGLGLTISRRIAHLMGGTLSLESHLGEGSCFWFTVRLEIAQPEPILHGGHEYDRSSEDNSLALNRLCSARVLLVEDNPINQQVALGMLEHLECEVVCADDGAQAIEQANSGTYDLILMDCQMPVIDGLTATELIRKSERFKKQRIPIVALTANAMADDRQRCIDAGMDDFLAKPFTLDDLQTKLLIWMPLQKTWLKP